MPTDGPTAKCYPESDQYQRWKEAAEENGMSVSAFIAHMVEAGFKKFSVEVEPDESNVELRRQRNDLADELERQRERNKSLETAIHRSEVGEIEEFVEDNPGATWEEIVTHVTQTAGERVTEHLEVLEGSSLRYDGENYYPLEGGDDGF